MTVIATWKDDLAQHDPSLVCQECGETICTVEEGDTFDVLKQAVKEHACLVWLITETCEYRIKAATRERAEELFLENGPTGGADGDGCDPPVEFLGVPSRTVEQAS